MFRHALRFTFLQTLSCLVRRVTKRTYYVPYNLNIHKLILGGNVSYALLTQVHAQTKEELHFEDEIKKAAVQGEKYLAHLMRVLRTLILQTSIEYQECLIKQIEMTKKNTEIGPVGEHWDELTAFRVKGNELKDELSKYEALATSIAGIVQQEVQSSLAVGNLIVLDQLNGELEKLQKLCSEQLQEIFKYEAELLAANRESILHGVRSAN